MKKILTLFLAVLMVFSVTVTASASAPTETEVYNTLKGLKAQYPEGMTWGAEKYYAWNGGIYTAGTGCVAFAFLLSDAAFGDLPARQSFDVKFEDVRAGDILRMNDDTHSVIVLRVFEDYLEIAEGSYNNSVHWGRILTVEDVEGSDYIMTRYPEDAGEDEPDTPVLPDGEYIDSGNCGEYSSPNVKWYFYETGELLIYGTGKMGTYSFFGGAPWEEYADRITSVTFSGELLTVSSYGFQGYRNLKTVTICDSVVEIGVDAFADCTALSTVKMSKSVKKIYSRAFQGCSSLTSIHLPEGLTVINVDAFSHSGLTAVDIPETVTYLGSNAFEQCNSLESVYIPGSVTNDFQYAFNSCDKLSTVTFGEGIRWVGRNSFANCPALKTVNFASTVTEIREAAFYYSGLETVVIPDSVTHLGARAFSSCENLKSVYVPATITTFEGDVFSYCKALETVTLEEGLTLLGSHAFDYAKSLKSVTIPGSIQTFPAYAFSRSGLTSVIISEGVTAIGKYAFETCEDLKEIHLPSTLKTVGYSAFGCYSSFDPTHVYYYGTEEQWSQVEMDSFNYGLEYAELHIVDPNACKHTETEIIPAVAPGCEISGLSAGKKCANPACGVILEEPEYVAPKGHSWQEGICFQPDTCKDCEAQRYMDRHDWQPATCEQPSICRLCGEANGIPASHTPEKGVCTQCGMTFFSLGDLNNDGKITAVDYMMLKRYVLRRGALDEFQKEAADVNGNGRIDAQDYALVKRHVLGSYKIV